MRFFTSRFLMTILMLALAMSTALAPRRALGDEKLSSPKFGLTPDSQAMSDLLATASGDLFSQRFDKLETDAAQLRDSKATAVTGEWKLGLLYGGTAYSVSNKENDADLLLRIFEKWAQDKPASITARVAQANALVAYAWRVRGDLSHNPSAAEQKAFQEKLTAARLVLREAKKLPEKCPYWWVVALRIGMAERWDRKTYDTVFQEAIQFEPECDEFYFQKAQYLRATPDDAPDNIESEWQDYITAAADVRGGEAGDILYARILWSLDKVGLIDRRYSDAAISFERYDKGFAALAKAHPDNLLVLNEWARMCGYAGSFEEIAKRKARARELFLKIGEHADEWVWRDAEQFILLRAATFDLPDFYETGLKKLEQGDNKGAIADFDQAMKMRGRNAAIYSARATAQINLKQYGFAKDDIEHAYTMEQGNPDYYLQLSYLYLQTKEWKFAANAAKLTLDRDPKRVGAFLNRAYAWRALGQTQDALDDYQKAIELSPETPILYALRGYMFFNLQKWPESLRDLRKYLSLSKPDADTTTAHFYIWLIRARRGETAAASKELKSFLAAQKTLPEWNSKIGAFLLDEIPEAQFLSAAEDQDAERASEKKTAAYFYAGMKHLIVGDKNGAREFFQKVPDFKNPSAFEATSALAEFKALPAQP